MTPPTTNPRDAAPKANVGKQIELEQAYVDGLFDKLDEEVFAAQERLRQVMLRVDPANPDAEALVERETEYHGLNEKIDRLNIAQLGLVFGRIDVETDNPAIIDNPVPGHPNVDRRYIGRMGLDDRDDDYRTLLLDWRAPLARPFYLATTAQPEGVVIRRHIRTKGRTVTGVDDERLTDTVLDPEDANDAAQSAGVAGEGALLTALNAARTGHMGSIVETIQREQDEIIRDETRGVMVVEGGPGTGKTAVALHRIAYLLYTWREQLARTGVLIIGPNRTFLEYISHVLPELGETGVVLSTVGDLFPGVHATLPEALVTREIKGSEEMVTILDRAVKAYQALPEQSREITIDGIRLTLDEKIVKSARTRARRARRPHNLARPLFRESLVDQLARQMAAIIGADPLGGANLLGQGDIAQLHDELAADPLVDELIDEFWPLLDPEEVLHDLLTSEDAIAQAAYDYDEETQAALFREETISLADPERHPFSAADAALLDELAVLIGLADPESEQEAERKRWREQIEEAQDALDVLSSSENTDLDDETDAEILSAFDVIDAESLAQRQQVRDNRSTAQRAREDYTWAYGHVIIDEAQELTPMEWRMVMRRCPSRWMTIVGDTSQTSSPAGVDSWSETLSPFVGTRFRTRQLTINYRTPAEVMEVANRVQAVFAPDVTPSTSLRSTGIGVRLLSDAKAGDLLARLQQEDPERLAAVITADSLAAAHADEKGFFGVGEIKGLEFDHVIVNNPRAIVDDSPQGWQDLFVALTRATQTLTVIGELPVA
ncbi:HelD family protein [Corynebacterium vitaeruminis]|uniref:HelD family protein n=1 Tax=Corynebacterium vitaeruminis TaxID=38305 RepID=UPI0005519C0B|nr:UvrD-helicase domain-containing protein [Corynebacterium vitaeruminis]